jgi:hypothetical protein
MNTKRTEIKKYPYKNMMTPYEKLKSIENAMLYLKEAPRLLEPRIITEASLYHIFSFKRLLSTKKEESIDNM